MKGALAGWMFILAALVLAPGTVIGSESERLERCAELAAYIWEPGFRETGIGWDKVNIDAALPACEAAHAELPEDAPTLFRLGRIHLQRKDFAAALPLLLKAAESGYSPAQTAYGTVFMNLQVEPDYELAYRWLSAAAKNGNPVAKANLGILYDWGKGVERNPERYVSLQLEAASAGVDFAQYNAAELYATGYGVERDLLTAEAWYRLSVAQGNRDAQRSLGILLDRIARSQEDYVEALNLLQVAADRGDSEAAIYHGWMVEEGHGAPADALLARESYERAYALGSPEAARFLGNVYEFGKGVPKDEERAFSFYLQGALFGDAQAQYRVGFFLWNGLGNQAEDDPTALAWFLRAAAQGQTDAQVSAAEMYNYSFEGQRTAWYDPDRALYWYEVAAQSGRLDAALEAAVIHASRGSFDIANAYVTHVLESGDEAMIFEAHDVIDVIEMIRSGQTLPV